MDKFDKVVANLTPYVFGFLGIITLVNHSYPLWGSLSLIGLMVLATIFNIISLAKRIRRTK